MTQVYPLCRAEGPVIIRASTGQGAGFGARGPHTGVTSIVGRRLAMNWDCLECI